MDHIGIDVHKLHSQICILSEDGALIASVSQDKMIRIWDLAAGQCLTALCVDGALEDVAWLPDGERLVAAGAGGMYFLSLRRPGSG